MGTVFKAIVGFGIAVYLWSPANFATHFDTSTAANLRGQIEAVHLHENLANQFATLKR